jgi:hypothetical protein
VGLRPTPHCFLFFVFLVVLTLKKNREDWCSEKSRKLFMRSAVFHKKENSELLRLLQLHPQKFWIDSHVHRLS